MSTKNKTGEREILIVEDSYLVAVGAASLQPAAKLGSYPDRLLLSSEPPRSAFGSRSDAARWRRSLSTGQGI